jgi:hypothetical protein
MMEDIIDRFQKSAGNFAEFHKGMSEREKVMFKKWLQDMRNNPQI